MTIMMGETVELGFITVILMILSTVLSANHGPIFDDDVAHITTVVGQTAFLPCNAIHRGNYKWKIIWMNPRKIVFANGETIVIDDARIRVEYTEHGDWNLRIDHVRFNDSGQYQCVINTTPIKMKFVHLTVHVPPHILHEESSGDMDVKEGDNVQLKCKATGYPTPKVTWYKRSETHMPMQENLKIQGEVLNITNIQRYQMGMYVCHADNKVPPSTTRQMLIKVQYAPVVKLLTRRMGQYLGKGTALVCSVTAYPRPQITWSRNGKPLRQSFKYRLEVYTGGVDNPDEYTLSLEMPYLNKNDYGEYVCHAQNWMGNETESMLLYEYTDPTAPHTTPTTTTDSLQYIYDERYKGGGEPQEGDVFPTDRRKYDPDKFYRGGMSKERIGDGSIKPYYQTESSASRSGLHFIYSFVLFSINVVTLSVQL